MKRIKRILAGIRPLKMNWGSGSTIAPHANKNKEASDHDT